MLICSACPNPEAVGHTQWSWQAHCSPNWAISLQLPQATGDSWSCRLCGRISSSTKKWSYWFEVDTLTLIGSKSIWCSCKLWSEPIEFGEPGWLEKIRWGGISRTSIPCTINTEELALVIGRLKQRHVENKKGNGCNSAESAQDAVNTLMCYGLKQTANSIIDEGRTLPVLHVKVQWWVELDMWKKLCKVLPENCVTSDSRCVELEGSETSVAHFQSLFEAKGARLR